MINLNTQQGSHKVQLPAELTLVQPKLNEDELQHITFYANLKMVPVYVESLDNKKYFEMVEQMFAVIYNSASHVSGWMLNKIKNLMPKW